MMNLFTKQSSNAQGKSQQKRILQNVMSEMSELFRRGRITMHSNNSHQNYPNPPIGITSILQSCAPYLYRTGTEFSGLELRLGHVPPCIVQGIANAVFCNGIPNSITQITPKVLQRRKLIGHIEKITKADEFLVTNDIDVSTIPNHLLMEACQDRMIHVSYGPNRISELQKALSDWLQWTKPQIVPSSGSGSSSGYAMPALETAKAVRGESNLNMATLASTTTSTSTVPDSDTTTTSSSPPKVYFNGNLARMIVMAYYGCASICTNEPLSPTMGHLPQLLYSSSSSKN